MNLQSSLPPTDPNTYLTWAEVDLAAIRHNYRLFHRHVTTPAQVFAVIKADAYGHGAVEVARALEEEKPPKFCVARVEEAAQLRDAGIQTPILVLAPPFAPQAMAAAKYDCSIVICDAAHAQAVAEAQNQTGRNVPVHIKVDVGMGRLGIPPHETRPLIQLCDSLRVPVEGIMAHLPCADAAAFAATEPMIQRFRDLQNQIQSDNPGRSLLFHVANSAATIRSSDAWMDAVRIGISLYGQFPSVEMEQNIDLRPAMTLKSRITYLKDVPAGTPISYSHTWKAPAPARLATVPVGYADGYPRHASNSADFIVNGHLAPQVGRVCMDQVVLDVTACPDVKLGDEVVAFGTSGDRTLRAEDVAARFGSIGYELTTRIGRRVPKLYIG